MLLTHCIFISKFLTMVFRFSFARFLAFAIWMQYYGKSLNNSNNINQT